MFYTYVLFSLKTGKLYVGYTENLRRRLDQHQAGQARSTKSGIPWKLVYYEACLERDKALDREKYLKTGYGRRFLKDRIKLQ